MLAPRPSPEPTCRQLSEAYNRWGGKSLYQFGSSMHAFEVSFDRPFDQQEFYNMVTRLELPWVRFLERNGIDVSYQTDVDTDRAPDRCKRALSPPASYKGTWAIRVLNCSGSRTSHSP